MKKIDITKPVRTVKDKRPVEIISDKFRTHEDSSTYSYSLAGYIENVETIRGDSILFVWNKHGLSSSSVDLNIENVPEKKVGYVNIYPDRDDSLYIGSLYSSKEDADDRGNSDRIARLRIEYEEGQFDE